MEAGREIVSWVVSLAEAVCLALIVRTFLFMLVRVKGASMRDSLRDGDRVYVSVLSARIGGYRRGDVVICRYDGSDHRCIKRVIGVPGDRVRVETGTVFVNGGALEEGYVSRRGGRSMEEIALREGEYFLMGDNRPVSRDSRDASVGTVKKLSGIARFIIWPPSRLGRIR